MAQHCCSAGTCHPGGHCHGGEGTGELNQALTGKLNILIVLRRLWGWERAASAQGQEGTATECNQAPGAASSPQPRRAQVLVSPTLVQPQGTGHKHQPRWSSHLTLTLKQELQTAPIPYLPSHQPAHLGCPQGNLVPSGVEKSQEDTLHHRASPWERGPQLQPEATARSQVGHAPPRVAEMGLSTTPGAGQLAQAPCCRWDSRGKALCKSEAGPHSQLVQHPLHFLIDTHGCGLILLFLFRFSGGIAL